MRKFVHEDKLRTPEQDGVEIHFLERSTAMLDLCTRDDGESFEQRRRLHATVCLDDADHDFYALAMPPPRLFQHGERLPHARAHAEENLQPSTPRLRLIAAQSGDQMVRIGPFFAHAITVAYRARG